ncbi:hypothetical protein CK203_086194 [Vitis vinifera]|uniref:Transposase Tnp1/En/Spm-like domain-containing protein n=1 Tax=Vitis vinifera TaxID=29760 RepID=A0A438DXG4_VITVI|nr:hypothetical protein CK203_086194 [Vitis vinifera]
MYLYKWKNNLWDTIEASFTLDSKSRRNCMLTMGKCFRSFKNMLTVKILKKFKKKEGRSIFTIIILVGKGYAGLEDEMMATTGYTEIIDRSILWKKAMEKKMALMMKLSYQWWRKIDKMLKESRESGRIFSGNNDILTEALGTPEYSGRPNFLRWMPSTPQSDVSSSNVKQIKLSCLKLLSNLSVKLGKCQLAIGTKENVVAAGTIILECGVNFLVVVDASYEPNAPLPVPIPNQIKTIGEALGYQVLWPAQMVSLTTHPIQMVDAKMAGRFAFVNPALVSKAGMGEASKETIIGFGGTGNKDYDCIYLDSLEDQPSDDLKEIVDM